MKRHLLALILCPVVAGAQMEEESDTPVSRAPWVIEVAGGLALRSSDATSQSLGFSNALAVGRMVSARTSWRATLEFDTWRAPSCPSSPCPSQEDLSLLALSFGFLATEVSHHREFYATVRAGLYWPVDTPNPSPGGYVGVGAAIPINQAALTIEAGLQGYYYIDGTGPDDLGAPGPAATTPVNTHSTWAVPIRVGYRWAL